MDKKQYCTLFVARHGETMWNIKKLIQGHSDSPLTKAGVLQAKDLAQELRHIKFDAFYSSDLLRAKRTAQLVALEHKLVVKTAQALRERRYGKLEGTNFEIINSLSEFERETRNKEAEVEETDVLIARFITYLREISVANMGKNVFVMTHGGVLRHFLIHLGFCTKKQIAGGGIGNAAWMKLKSDGVDFFVEETKRIEIDLSL